MAARDALAVVGAAVLITMGAAADASPGEPREVQAQRAVMGFVLAYNSHEPEAALSFFTADPRFGRFVGASDCEFRRGRTVIHAGRSAVQRWLRGRAADRDRLTLASFRLLDTQRTPSVGAALTFARRSNRTLTALGYAEGVGPQGAKIGFTTSGPVRITRLALAAGVGQPCGP